MKPTWWVKWRCWRKGHSYLIFPGKRFRRTFRGYAVVRPIACDVCGDHTWADEIYYLGEPPQDLKEMSEWSTNHRESVACSMYREQDDR